MDDKLKRLEELEKRREKIGKELARVKRSMALSDRKVDAHMKICIGVSILEIVRLKKFKPETVDSIFRIAQEKAGKNNPAWTRLQGLRDELAQQTQHPPALENQNTVNQN